MIESAQAAPPDSLRPRVVHSVCHPIRMNEMA